MLTHEEEIKLRLFKSIAAHSKDLCDTGKYRDPENVVVCVNNVYNQLFKDE